MRHGALYFKNKFTMQPILRSKLVLAWHGCCDQASCGNCAFVRVCFLAAGFVCACVTTYYTVKGGPCPPAPKAHFASPGTGAVATPAWCGLSSAKRKFPELGILLSLQLCIFARGHEISQHNQSASERLCWQNMGEAIAMHVECGWGIYSWIACCAKLRRRHSLLAPGH